MMPITLADAAQATGGTLYAAPGTEAAGLGLSAQTFHTVSTDSRKPMPNALFVALRGERFDGHKFVAAAQSQGMVAAMVDEAGHNAIDDPGLPRLVVKDTLFALGQLARHARRLLAKPVIAVTGSNGKTTTKELLAAALQLRGPVHKTPGNLNNLVGLPLTVFGWPDEAWAAVLEMGMNAPGEIARLAEVAEPQAGLITCVAAAHLQGLGSIERIAQAKVELLAGLPQGATAIINSDDGPLCVAAAPHLRGRPSYRFGTGTDAQVRLLEAKHVREGEAIALRVTLQVQGKTLKATLPLVGQHNGMNAAAAVAGAVALGLDANEALQSMREVRIPGARGRVLHNLETDVWILDDCYNANPHSMGAALRTLQNLAQSHPTVAILGDMLELGEGAAMHHEALGADAQAAGVAKVFAFGALAQATVRGAQGANTEAMAFADLDALLAALRQAVKPRMWCLVKGSRGMRLERVVDALMQHNVPSLARTQA